MGDKLGDQLGNLGNMGISGGDKLGNDLCDIKLISWENSLDHVHGFSQPDSPFMWCMFNWNMVIFIQ